MFKHFFVTTYQKHRVALWIIAACLVIEFVVYKILYPHPNFMPDSYGYLGAATKNESISTWPIGYSRFLRIESAFTKNDIVLVLFQYLFLQFSILHCLFKIDYYLPLKQSWLYVLAGIFVLNPIALFISNYVAADALFTGLTLLWFCVLLDLLLQPMKWLVWIQAMLLILLFTIRYNALYYPVIATGVLLFAKLSWRIRLSGIGLMFLLIGLFVWHNEIQYRKLTGKAQFSPFGGWMLAGNALFMYSRLPKDKEPPPAKFSGLQQLVDHHMDSLQKAKARPDSMMGIYYIWDGPLRKYMNMTYKKDSTTGYFKRWAIMGGVYQEYGAYLIKKHLGEYARYFLLPNAGYYFSPPAEFLDIYNQGWDSVGVEVKDWFGYKDKYVKAYSKRIDVAGYVSVVNTLLNIVFFVGLLGFLTLKGNQMVDAKFRVIIGLTLVVSLCNFLFSVTLAPIVLRYQIFSFVLIAVSGFHLLSVIYKMSQLKN